MYVCVCVCVCGCVLRVIAVGVDIVFEIARRVPCDIVRWAMPDGVLKLDACITLIAVS